MLLYDTPMPKPITLGGKITSSHGTITETSTEIVHIANKLPHVTKISLGEIRHVPGGRRDIKFSPINAGIKATVRGNGTIQYIFIYTKQPDETMSIIKENFTISP